MSVTVCGVGMSRFEKQQNRPAEELAVEAVHEALEDAGFPTIDAAYAGSVFESRGIAQRVLHAVGITGVPILRYENACATGSTAFHEGVVACAEGRFETVLVFGVDHLTSRIDGPVPPVESDAEGATGLPMPGMYAMAAERYLHLGWATPETLALVAQKNRGNGARNERAGFGGAYTIDDILASRPIADPLTLLQCCPVSDGAAAAVISTRKPSAGEVVVTASTLASGGRWDYASEHVWGFELVRDTAAKTLRTAGWTIDEVDVLEVHDAFTIGEIVTLEALGLADEGNGASLARARTTLTGRVPVNPSGGLLARGHPYGATGLAQIAEIVWQLRHDAGDRQVAGARRGLVETMGGGTAGLDGNACVVATFERVEA